MAAMKNLADGTEHILRDILFLLGDGYGGCQSEHGLAHIFGKYAINKDEVYGQEIVERGSGIVSRRSSR
jgi:hypothetical protein